MSKKNEAVQGLKSERVQEELALLAGDPFRIALKAERVQEPAFAVLGEVPLTSAFELTLNQQQPVSIELQALQVVITLHGTTPETKNPADALEAPDQTR